MTTNLSERAREILAETLPLMEQHRASLEEALERYTERQSTTILLPGRSKITTATIMDMLLGHAAQLAENGLAADIAQTARRHNELGVGGEYYSSFGDGLKPIMKDVLGAKATSPVLAAWTDAYWALVRLRFARETRRAA